MNKNQSFFAGQEEVLARISSLVISTIFFLIFIIAREQINLNYQSAIIFISIFWVVYESLALILFQLFSHFANNKKNSIQEIDNSDTSIEKPILPPEND